jgi:hypothetical protein
LENTVESCDEHGLDGWYREDHDLNTGCLQWQV